MYAYYDGNSKSLATVETTSKSRSPGRRKGSGRGDSVCPSRGDFSANVLENETVRECTGIDPTELPEKFRDWDGPNELVITVQNFKGVSDFCDFLRWQLLMVWEGTDAM